MNIGTHIICDMYEIGSDTFEKISKKNYDEFNIFMENVIKKNNMTLLNKTVHYFDDISAFTSLYLLAESHLSIHTWPENKFIAIDIFTCGKADTHNIMEELKIYFKPEYIDKHIQIRGKSLFI